VFALFACGFCTRLIKVSLSTDDPNQVSMSSLGQKEPIASKSLLILSQYGVIIHTEYIKVIGLIPVDPQSGCFFLSEPLRALTRIRNRNPPTQKSL